MRLGYTLIEIVLVTVVMGVLATLAMSRYTTVVERQRSQRALANLDTVYGAGRTLYSRTKSYPIGTMNRDQINTAFALSIMDNDFTYSFESGDSTSFTASTIRTRASSHLR